MPVELPDRVNDTRQQLAATEFAVLRRTIASRGTARMVIAAVTTMGWAALAPRPTPIEMGVIGTLHAAFLFRIVRARGAAARQRAVDLESFKAVLSNSLK